MLTHADPTRLAALGAALAAIVVVVAVVAVSADQTPATVSTPSPPTTSTPQVDIETGLAASKPSRPVLDPAPGTHQSTDVNALVGHDVPADLALGRAAQTPWERRAVDRLVADATGAGRHVWPDLDATPCCRDLTVTGVATTSTASPPAVQTVLITWTASDRYDGRATEGVTTTSWRRVDDRWAVVHPGVRTDRRPDGRAEVRAARDTQTSLVSAAPPLPLLSGGLVAARAADNCHTPCIPPSAVGLSCMCRGYDSINRAAGAPCCRWGCPACGRE